MENLTSQNDQFLEKIYREIEDNLQNEHYSVEDLAGSAGLSRSMLHRKLKKLTGKPARDLITQKRLEKARELLEHNVASASEVAYHVGFNSPSYFSKVFKKYYGVSPGDYRKGPEKYSLPPLSKKAEKLSKRKKLRKYIWPALIIGNIVLVYIIINAWNPVPFEERDWVVITDFDNQTNETIFDKSLNTAFILSISQSRFINVITRQRMMETLKRMKKEDHKNIDENTGREIAMREGIDICIVPGISGIGSQYILTAKILEAQTTEILRSEIIYVKSKDDIIRQMDKLTRKVRKNLGESYYMISKQNLPLSKVTTTSLDALKQFSLGLECHINMEFDEAIIYYKNAIEIDTGFTAAKASLGNLLCERYDHEKGIELMNQVLKSIDDLTVRERYSILAKYAANVDKDFDKAIEYTRRLIDLYPDDPRSYNNLGWYYQHSGEYEKAVREYKEAVRIDPYTMIAYGGIGWIYLEYLGQMDSALLWARKLIQHGPQNPWGYVYLGNAFAALDSLEKAEAAMVKAKELNPNLVINIYNLAHLYRVCEKYTNAIDLLLEIAHHGAPDEIAHYHIGVNYELIGKREQARHHFLIFREAIEKWLKIYPNDPLTYIRNGAVLTRLGEKDLGWEIGKIAIEMDSSLCFEFAAFLTIQEKKEEAMGYLEKALEKGYRDLPWIKLNPDLDALRNEKRFKELINEYF